MMKALEMEPSLSPEIVGAWWFPEDMNIDAQRLFRVLEQACTNAGVEILEGCAGRMVRTSRCFCRAKKVSPSLWVQYCYANDRVKLLRRKMFLISLREFLSCSSSNK